jgi:hypothetical protein
MLRKLFQKLLRPVENFEYESILPEGSIRVLELWSGKQDEPVRCRLKQIEVEREQGKYDALSYVWGNPNDVTSIICNGRRLSITKSLANALQALRDTKKKRILWADAICINQSDTTEKGHQVKNMGHIYEHARRVIIWLGKDTEGIARDCFGLIRESVNYLERELEIYGETRKIPALDDSCLLSRDKTKWKQLEKLSSLEWFSRAWVVQEVGLAREGILVWGTEQTDIADFIAIVLYYHHVKAISSFTGDLNFAHIEDSFLGIQARYTNQQTWRGSKHVLRDQLLRGSAKPPLFLDILLCATALKSSDKRDMVYAFIGSPLARNEDAQLLIEPDYDKDLDEVFFETTVALLKHPREAPWVLQYVFHTTEAEVEGKDYPSWALRWDRFQEDCIYPNVTVAWYNAGGEYDSFHWELLKNKRLGVRGIIFDHLTWTSRLLSYTNFQFDIKGWDVDLLEVQNPILDHVYHELLSVVGRDSDRLADDFFLTLCRGWPGRNKPSTRMLSILKSDFEMYRQQARSVAISNNLTVSDWSGDVLRHFFKLHNRRLALTRSGRLGIVPNLAKPGDKCWIVLGVPVPLIIRETQSGHYNLVGDSYVHGVMGGELINHGIDDVRDISLV